MRKPRSVYFKNRHVMMTSWHFLKTVLLSSVIGLIELEPCASVNPVKQTSALELLPLKSCEKVLQNCFCSTSLKTPEDSIDDWQRAASASNSRPPPHSLACRQQSFLLFLQCTQEDPKATDSSQTDTSCLEAPCGRCHHKLQPTSASRLSEGGELVMAWEVFACPLHNLPAS